MFFFFFFNDTATTEIYTLSLHDALPIYRGDVVLLRDAQEGGGAAPEGGGAAPEGGGDRKSTRLNSSHVKISYAVFCLKKKKNTENKTYHQQVHASIETNSVTWTE